MSDITIDGNARAILLYLVVAEIIGLAISIFILSALYRKSKVLNANNLPTANIILSGLIFSIAVLMVNAVNMDAKSNEIPFSLCQISGVLTLASGTVLLVTVAFSAMYRYVVIVLKRRHLSKEHMTYALAAIWITFLLLWLIPPLAPTNLVDPFEVSNFGGACTPNFTSRKPIGWIVSTATIAGILGTPLIVTLAYRAIWIKLIRAKENVTSLVSPETELEDQSHSVKKGVSTEQVIVKQAMIVASLYALFWSPVAVVWTVECVTGREVSPLLVGLSYMLPATHSYVSPLAVLYMDRSFRNACLELVRLPTNSSDHNLTSIHMLKTEKTANIDTIID